MFCLSFLCQSVSQNIACESFFANLLENFASACNNNNNNNNKCFICVTIKELQYCKGYKSKFKYEFN